MDSNAKGGWSLGGLLRQKNNESHDTDSKTSVNGETMGFPSTQEPGPVVENREDTREIAVEAVAMEDDSGNTAGTGGSPVKFIIPDEGEEDLLDEHEVDVGSDMTIGIRKPGRNEFFQVLLPSLYVTHILAYKSNPEAMDESLLYVKKELRGKISQELRQAKFYLCRSCVSGRFFIWMLKVSDTDWYRSLEVLFRNPEEFFRNNALRIRADKDLGRYRIFAKPESEAMNWPAKPMAELVTEAIGQANIISSADHPVYADLTSGEELK